VTEYRASFDAEVDFINGGSLHVKGFRIDVPSDRVTSEEIAALFVQSLGLLMAGAVRLSKLMIVAEPHRGTRDTTPARSGANTRLVELSHVVRDGMVTFPGLPAPAVTAFRTHEQSREHYAPGTEFAIDSITMVGNTGTYVDSPYHRYETGDDLAALPLERLANLPAVVVRVIGADQRGVSRMTLAALGDLRGAAVLIHTGDAERFGTPEYATEAAFLTRSAAEHLVEAGVALVGIDSVNIDSMDDPARPAHTVLLAAGVPIVEHLTGLDQLPPRGARFTATPPRVAHFGSFPVRAFAEIPR
jgi:kynurenine formamidase